jgi:hypothetical protein
MKHRGLKVSRRAAAPPQEIWEEAEFLNIDLDVRSRRSLAPLVAAWPGVQQPLRTDGKANPHWLIHTRRQADTAEATARLLLKDIAALSPAARRCWNQASKRTFDIGVRADMGGRAFEGVQLTPDTLARIAAVGGRLQVTVYRPRRA